jgi:signal transduction histidine kinase
LIITEGVVITLLLLSIFRRRRLEESLRKAEQAAREFGERVIRAQEEERARLARELHDDITQRLARLAMDVEIALKGRHHGHNGHNEKPAASFKTVRDGIVQLSEDVHSLAYQLHPSFLDDLGLPDALRAECDRFSREESIPVLVSIATIPPDVSREVGLCLFRITQEALRNVARHSRASEASVSLHLIDEGLQLVVSDSGVGFGPGNGQYQKHLGFVGMRERAQLLDGEVDIVSNPGHGTSVVAWVPLKKEVNKP